jgi:hypothetical protein
MKRSAIPALLAIALLIACKTPDAPRQPIPVQDVHAPVPDGMVRVVLFNASNHALYFESGPIRIQLDGRQLPSIWLDHYVQVFVPPGEHQLLLEHYDLFMWKGRYTIHLSGPEAFLKVYNRPTTTRLERVDELPEDFFSRFKPRDPDAW